MNSNQVHSEDSNPYKTLDIQQLLHQRGYEVENFYRLSELVNAGLSKEMIAIVIDLIEKGVDPESISKGNELLSCRSNLMYFDSYFTDEEQTLIFRFFYSLIRCLFVNN